MTATSNPFLRGAFEPVYGEHTEHDLPVSGRIPEELDGLFTQIGPSPVRQPGRLRRSRYIWFTQDGLVHGIRIEGGRAKWYRNRWIRSRRVSRALRESRPPGPRHFFNDVVNTNVICHGNMLLALVEAGCVPARLSPTLDTVEYTDLGGSLPRGFSAHPKLDPHTGELFAVAYTPRSTRVDYLVVGVDGRVRKLERLSLGGRPMMHDIGLTRNYALLYDLSVRFHIPTAISGRFPFVWDPGHQARIGVLPRDGDRNSLRWFDIPSCYVLHTINAHDDGERVTIDAIRYPRMFEPGRDPLSYEGVPWRWIIDLRTGGVTEHQLDDRPQELPRIDPRLVGREYRYSYAIAGDSTSVIDHEPTTLVCRDSATGTTLTRGSADQVPSEMAYIPGDSDGGWLVYLALDRVRQASDLIIVDAADFSGPPVAVVHLPRRVPYGAHSNWIPATDLIREQHREDTRI
ncbi:carotenoid oxygenase family protein [Nocardia sp. NPDC056100]|uniref:carotenoid oxygenase family protein n=1 Tax=Nocardia sp. NPDC056100 TaxID=3345712 RepID=UPI0035D837B4